MKLTAILIVGICLHAAASGHAQNVTYSAKDVTIKKVLNAVKNQTGFDFMVEDVLGEKRVAAIQESQTPLNDFLTLLLHPLKMEFVIRYKTIFVRRASSNPLKPKLALDLPPITVRGKVVNEKGEPVVGASVIVRGGSTGVATDAYGLFEIQNVPENGALVISAISIETREFKINGKSELNLVVSTRIATEDEVTVSTGYWTSTKVRSTGNIEKVASKDIERQPVTSPLMALQGRMAGVDISPTSGAPGSSVNIRVRGNNSLRPDGAYPLYVIDGIPIESSPVRSASIAPYDGHYDPLATLDPSNIESIEVLKDAAATSIYGSRGANGVIRITTKGARADAKTGVDINIYRGIGKVAKKFDLLNTHQYLQMRNEAYSNDGLTPSGAAANDLLLWDTTRYTDWQKVLLGGNADITDAQTSVHGGNDRTYFNLGAGYHEERTVFPGDFGFKRFVGHFNLNHTSVNRKFKATLSTNYGSTDNVQFNDATFVNIAFMLPPNAPKLYNENGELNWEVGPNGANSWVNPMSYLMRTNKSTSENLVANSGLSYELITGLNIKLNLGFTNFSNDEIIKDPIASQPPTSTGSFTGTSTFAKNSRKTWVAEPQLTFEKSYKEHQFNFLLGSTFQSTNMSTVVIRGTGYTSDALLNSLQGAATKNIDFDERAQYRYNAVYSYLGYSFKNRYLLDFTFRRDGSSRFGPGKQFGNFGSISGGWIFSEERIFQGSNFINFGKVRGSYGITGNDQIPDYRYLNVYAITDYPFFQTTSFYPYALYNPDFAWEETRKSEIALELGFFKNRITTQFAYFNNKSTNQLLDYMLPTSTGFPSVFANFDATIRNYGWEFLVNTTNIKSRDFKWTTSFNLTVAKNKLTKFDGLEDSPYSTFYKVGEPVSIQRYFMFSGVNAETGLFTVVDQNEDGLIDDNDKLFMFSLDKPYYGGINNTFEYKAFSLSFLFQFSKQKSYKFMPIAPGRPINQSTSIFDDRWQKTGDEAIMQKFSRGSPASTAYNRVKQSDYVVEDGSFIRLKTLSLGYSLPNAWLNTIKVRQAMIFVQGQNLLTFTNATTLDPETGMSLPPLRMLTFGINFKF